MKRLMSSLQYLPGWTNSLAARMAWGFLFTVILIALIGPLLANEKPYYCKLEGRVYFPMFSNITEAGLSVVHPSHSPVSWKTTPFETVLRAPIAYSHSTIDLNAGTYSRPGHTSSVSWHYGHWLGTDGIGRDVLAGMIRGCRVSLLIGLGSMLLALLIGVPLGASAAWWGNKEWRISYVQFALLAITFLLIILIWFTPLSFRMRGLISMVILLTGFIMLHRSSSERQGRISMPLDRMVMGTVSIIDGFPGLFLILVLVAIVPAKGWVVIMFTIALLRWPSMARYMRAEVYKMKEMNYIRAAQILNVPSFQILRRQVIPFAFRPVMISFVFGVSTAILAESSLSFLGIGLPAEENNWGRLLAQSRNHFDAWWLVVFPGLAIFLTLLSLYTIGNEWQKSVSSE
jgi:peptide/nickel transport system permease protein